MKNILNKKVNLLLVFIILISINLQAQKIRRVHYSEGRWLVSQEGKYGYTTDGGRPITKIEYDWGDDFYYGMAMVKKNKKYGFINKRGKLVVPCIYEDANRWNGNSGTVILGWKKGKVNKRGKYTYLEKVYKIDDGFPNGKAYGLRRVKY